MENENHKYKFLHCKISERHHLGMDLARRYFAVETRQIVEAALDLYFAKFEILERTNAILTPTKP